MVFTISGPLSSKCILEEECCSSGSVLLPEFLALVVFYAARLMQELKYEGHAEEGGVCATPALSVDITDPEWASTDADTRKRVVNMHFSSLHL